MNTTRKMAIPAGSAEINMAKRIVGTSQGHLLDPILNAPDYLAKAFPNKAVIALGSLMWSINNGALAARTALTCPT